MYTPKIREDLIPRLYRLAKTGKTTMTALVDALLEKALTEIEPDSREDAGGHDEAASTSRERRKRRKQR